MKDKEIFLKRKDKQNKILSTTTTTTNITTDYLLEMAKI